MIFLCGADFRDAWSGLKSAPGRIAVMLLALVVGSGALAILFCASQGLRGQARQIVQDFGANVFAIAPDKNPNAGASGYLRTQHGDLLRGCLPSCEISALAQDSEPVSLGAVEAQVVHADSHLAAVRNWRILDGRFLDDTDMAQRARVAVLTEDLADRLRLAVGQIFFLKQTPFRIVGIISPSSVLGFRNDTDTKPVAQPTIFMPITTPAYWSPIRMRPDRVDAILVHVAAEPDFASVIHRSEDLLSDASIHAGRSRWITPEYVLQPVRRMQAVLRWTAGSITMLSLLLGGATLFSLMLNNVRERIPEIGLRRSLGALPRDIAKLFLLEAGLVTATAGMIGSLLGHSVLIAAESRLPVRIETSWTTLLLPVGVCLGVGLLFCFLPAHRAAGIRPSEALRND